MTVEELIENLEKVPLEKRKFTVVSIAEYGYEIEDFSMSDDENTLYLLD